MFLNFFVFYFYFFSKIQYYFFIISKVENFALSYAPPMARKKHSPFSHLLAINVRTFWTIKNNNFFFLVNIKNNSLALEGSSIFIFAD